MVELQTFFLHSRQGELIMCADKAIHMRNKDKATFTPPAHIKHREEDPSNLPATPKSPPVTADTEAEAEATVKPALATETETSMK